MELKFVLGGKPFVPQTRVRDLLEALDAKPGTEVETVNATVDFCHRILQRTDPGVSRDALLDLAPWELRDLRAALLTRPREEALGEAAAPGEGA